MKIFEMIRGNDESHISGTGSVLSGVIFDSGDVVVSWHSATKINSLGIYKNLFEFYFIHCESHPTNNTILRFLEDCAESPIEYPDKKCEFCGNTLRVHPKDVQGSKTSKVRTCEGRLVTLS